ncbi:hypothetical protein ACZ81_10935 [Alteromonas macleodii]|uniref:hypothetical protein n=1 Tax=Alteromonas macleodii TaxID=28108 RepID=UPI0007774AEA|nr:hypothetical protein [Alteromonas macleodii]AMN12055.1 hypothetical protein ACZ81_10935 [Alteromonas macleodii]
MKIAHPQSIDRLPTRRERILAIFLGFICSTITGAVSFLGIHQTYKGELEALDYTFYYLLFSLSVWALIRAVFYKSGKAKCYFIYGYRWNSNLFSIVILFLAIIENTKFEPKGIIGCLVILLVGALTLVYGFTKRKRP